VKMLCEKRMISSALPEAIAPSRGVTVYVVLFERYCPMTNPFQTVSKIWGTVAFSSGCPVGRKIFRPNHGKIPQYRAKVGI